ncbi:MAG: ammonium transporter, partial [Dehalococcoidales bacterium]|nr:ammonium transporter [Dehalococcoidales bacterium]
MFMTPGLALFYGGMVRRKNLLSTIMMSFACIGLVTVLWMTYGYSIGFAPGIAGGLVGNLEYLGLKGVGQEPLAVYAATVPHLAFMTFQGMFAVIALATGIFASAAINPTGADGLVNGGGMQVVIQMISVVAVAAFAFIGSIVIGKVVNATVGLRVKPVEETIGLDLSQHAESVYGGSMR